MIKIKLSKLLGGINRKIDSADDLITKMLSKTAKFALKHTLARPLNSFVYGDIGKRLSAIVESEKKREEGSILVRMKRKGAEDFMEAKCELGEQLRKHFGAKSYYAFKHIPYISICCEARTIDSLLSENKRVGAALLRGSLAGMYSGATRSFLLYTPEKAFQYAKELKIPSFKSKNCGNLWNLKNINADRANEVTTGEGVTVAVIDTGVDYRHGELSGRFDSLKGVNIVYSNDDPMDDNGHGTHVAGTIAGNTTGVAPGSRLYGVKVLDSDGSGTLSDVVRGIEWAIDHEVDVINMSLGSSSCDPIEQEICDAAYNAGIIVCAAAGNSFYGPNYPAHLENVLAVTAVDRNNDHAEFSNIYSMNDISAPGVDIKSTFPGNRYDTLSGTSMATPHISGVALLARSMKKNLSVSGYENLVKETARKLGDWDSFGAGLVLADSVVGNAENYRVSTRLLRLVFR